MKKFFIITCLISLTATAFAYHLAFAQEGADPASAAASDSSDAIDISYSYGIVTSVSPEEITLLEYDYDRDEEVQVVYKIAADTEFNNIGSVDKIAKNDEVEIYYVDEAGIKTAKSIEKEEVSPAEADVLGGAYDDSAEDVYLEEVPANGTDAASADLPEGAAEPVPPPAE
ncbi:MAG: hypothetical protein A2787_09950 [Omnitrophica WOR_2 bacterium RIFCSPHIGHO2_01_FULL_48_9]|nr:MAG: hypothetical protein A3D10_09605 [Omnitrophica WOR_2 bacterium RIFCSPHIGHO2_02_FULL_48_11]OGX31586.1 MAG: hypothetical protein A2787_09950 [Omnitrophica WOR_2 bacterium RIFCSPHIGHO2_01_FULL_48_9]